MKQDTDYLKPGLIEVDERSDLRQSPRNTPIGLHAELFTALSPRPKDCHCLNLSQHGISLLCDMPLISVGDRANVNLWNSRHRVMDLTGTVVRIELTKRFTRIAISFDGQHTTDQELRALAQSS